ncbi:MAG: phage terminase large subunit family protein [Clostridiaceae bacterium]|nr:phage terminase large subunit family protein [Clostridiaceae bacterium]DAM37297.1 MAG TPA: terminase large subunit [Caudoviricetes sp.]
MAKTTRNKPAARLNAAIAPALEHFRPPTKLTVSGWADQKRRLSPETSAESGPWRTSRTPYLKEPMDAFNDPRINRIVMVASSQVGKSELELNIIGYIIDQDPGSILYIQPTLDDAKKFSRLRVAPMIRDSHLKVADVKAKDSGNTILQKSFPGGMLTITGSNSASALASTPARYIIGDERDRWATSAGTEGDPWALAEARQTTFYNRKAVEVSTPTVKGSSQIADSFELGTQEHWCHRCPDCGEYHCIDFDDIVIDKTIEIKNGRRKVKVASVMWACPSCGCTHDEETMRTQPAKWIADNPEAYERGIRSFWLTAFASPWVSWIKIATKFLEAGKDPEKLKVVFNTLLGKLWEDRGEIPDDDAMLSRRETYGAELPNGVLVLTCGVDTQDDRLEYEVAGFGKFGESWGIKKGVCLGRPDTDEPWQRLDDVIGHVYKFADGHGLRISITMVDSGGHFTQEVYQRCRARQNRMVFAVKGKGGDGIPFTQPPRKTKIVIKGQSIGTCWLYTLGVDAGKTIIMDSLKVQEPGAKYCHFPSDDGRGYDASYFNGLLSEKLTLSRSKGATIWRWEKLPGHQRNEPLDCRDYALAGLRIIDPDMEAIERRLRDLPDPQPEHSQKPAPRRSRRSAIDSDDW